MLRYCNSCKKQLTIDSFYTYKKNFCKQCLNKKINCDYRLKEFNNTSSSKHIKQIYASTYNTNSS